MKKLTAVIAAVALFFSASAFGPTPENDHESVFNLSNAKAVKAEKVKKAVSVAFTQKFATATEINWTKNQSLYFGYFKQDGHELIAAFTDDGDLFAFIRKLQLNELPAAINQKLADKFAGSSVSGSISEITMQGETNYYLTLENKTCSKLVKFYEDGQDELLKKTKKKVLVATVI